MESRLDTEYDQVVISLTNEECTRIAEGDMITDRNNPFDPMAKVEVAPFSQLDPTYEPYDGESVKDGGLIGALSRVACRAMILDNNDIRVFVPHELVKYRIFTAETISAKNIQASDEVMPAGGIRVEFSSRLI